ncbi:MAG: DUF11 domain-containing protein [Deltaproteobacteria bacterium]|nr:DUF11 domain-containing protein [Deltaproteobacteria bacterium]
MSGFVYYDQDQDGQVDDETFGVPNAPVELYLIAADTDSNTGSSNTSTAKSATPRAALDAESTLLGKSAQPSTAKATPTAPAADPAASSTETPDDPSTPPADPYAAPSTPAEPETPAVPSEPTPPAADATATPAPRGKFVASMHTDKRGSFSFGGLEPGEYEVRIGSDYGPLKEGYRVTTGGAAMPVKAGYLGAHVEVGMYRPGLNLLTKNCPDKIVAGEKRLCEVMYRNDAPTPLDHPIITVTLPQEIDVVAHDNGVYIAQTHQVQWVWPSIAPGQIVPAGFVIIPRPQSAREVELRFEWKLQSLTDPQETLVTAIETSISAEPRLQLQVAGPKSALPGKSVQYEVAYVNQGALQLNDAALTVTLPAEITHAATTDGTWAVESHELRWSLGTIPLGGQGARYFTIETPAVVAKETKLIFRAGLKANGLADGVQTNEFLTALQPNMEVLLTASPSPQAVVIDKTGHEDLVTWTVTVKQSGEKELKGVKLVATLDPNLSLQTITHDGSFVGDAQQVVWELGSVAGGGEVTVTVSAEPSDALTAMLNTLKMSFELSADALDPITKSADIQAKFESN